MKPSLIFSFSLAEYKIDEAALSFDEPGIGMVLVVMGGQLVLANILLIFIDNFQSMISFFKIRCSCKKRKVREDLRYEIEEKQVK